MKAGEKTIQGAVSLLILLTSLAMIVPADALAAPPAITDSAPISVIDTKAKLGGRINPNGEGTSYRFEYVTATEFEKSGYAEATTVPTKEAGIGNGIEDVSVSQLASGLTPETAYRFRLVATNPSGSTFSTSTPFTTSEAFDPLHSFGPCPNDALRGGPEGTGSGLSLPDCRAYEQVTPVDKNGNTVEGDLDKMRAAINGQTFLYYATAPLPVGKGPRYLAAREEAGWSSSWFGEKVQSVTDWSEDLASAFGSDSGLGFGREYTDDHSFEPISGSGRFVGASADGSKTFFQSGNELKVWDRDAQAVTLVAAAAIGGAYDWWNGNLEGGGANFGYYTQDQNVVSNDGSRVYFTSVGDGQLFLREDPAGPSPLTIPVSTSQKDNGGGPGGTDPSGSQPAAFMSATPEGSHAFFTSSEELTNDANTGADAIGRANLDGTSPNHSFLIAGAKGVAVDSSYIYWAIPGQDAIGRASLDGTSVNPNFITGADRPQYVAVDGSFIYWTNAGTKFSFEGSIGRANLDGSDANQEFITAEVSQPEGIAVNATHIFWGNASFSPAIARANIDGTEANSSFVSLFGGKPGGVAANSTHVFWTTPTGDAIGRVNTDGTKRNGNFITGAARPQGIALDGTNLYWSNSASATIGRGRLDGTEAEQSFLSSFKSSGVAVDPSNIFWSADGSNAGKDLYRFDAESGELLDLSADPTTFNGADVRAMLGAAEDGSRAYFVANGDLDGGGSAAPGDCSQSLGEDLEGFTGTCNVYLWSDDGTADGDIAFVARLDTDPYSGFGRTSDAINWMPGFLTSDGITNSVARVSTDGDTLLFRSQVEQTDYDNEAASGKCILVDSPVTTSSVCPQFYRYDATKDEVVCVTCNPTGARPVATPTLYSLDSLAENTVGRFLTRNLSADGNRFFFESADKLLSEDVNGDIVCPSLNLNASTITPLLACQDVYMWEAEGTGSCESATVDGGCLYLLSTGTGEDPSFLGDASLTGDDVFIYSYEPLVGRDDDEITDIYDVRVGGGLASQYPPDDIICTSLGKCKPPSPSPPIVETPTTSSFTGPGDSPRSKSRPCPKGKRKVRVKGKSRCVPKRNRKQPRNANSNRRASR